LVLNETVIVLEAPAKTVLCSMDFMVNTGLSTCNGLYPLTTPYNESVLEVINSASIDPMTLPPLMISDATLTDGDVWDIAGLMRANLKTTGIPEFTTDEAAVSTSCPAF